ncbi:LysR family transcriptional regulator [Variovorax paradoxus]|nr:LysR family transcriptional regulator [Variovorax paradoxus]MBT2304689.1 LysR family transcriptional regulator [Variovorax paradoxus]
MNISTRQLQAFLAAARLGSFTRAAEEIFVTQAGLSLMLKDLETQVGARLFDRTTRSVHLTLAGESLLPTVRSMLADWESATSSIGRLSAEAEQQLTLAATPLIAASVLPRWLRDFHQTQPGIRVQISDLDRRHILLGIEAGEIDLGLGAFFKPAAGIERQLLATFQMVRVSARSAVSNGRKSGTGPRVHWSALAGDHLLTLPNDNPIQKLVDAQLRGLNAAPSRSGALQNIQAMIAMVEAGHGVATLPAFVAPACARYEVSMQTLVEPLVPIDFFVVSKKGRQKTALAARLIDALGKHFREIAKSAEA